MLIEMLCLLSSCQKATGNEQTSGTTNADRQTSALTTGNNNLDLPFETDERKMVAVSDSDIAKLRIGMTMSEVSKILKEKYSMPSSLIYPFIYSWKMSDGDFIVVVFEIEGYKIYDDYLKARKKAIFGDNPVPDPPYNLSKEQKERGYAFDASAKMVCAIRRSNGESLIGETDD
jgi:hypothetical protein